MLRTVKNRLIARRTDDRGDLVQTVLLIGGFAVAAIILIMWIAAAITNQAADAANCIETTKDSYTPCGRRPQHAESNGIGGDQSWKCTRAHYDRYFSQNGGCFPHKNGGIAPDPEE